MAKEDKPAAPAWRLPTTGTILKYLCEAFELTDRNVTNEDVVRELRPARTRAYFEGKRVEAKTKLPIVRAVATGLVLAGVLPALPGQIELKGDTDATEGADLYTLALMRLAEDWDEVTGLLRSRGEPPERIEPALASLLRLFAIDLSIRLMSIQILGSSETMESVPLDWAAEFGGNSLVRQCLDRLLGDGKSQASLADKLGVSQQAVSKWCSDQDYTSISDLNLRGLSEFLARQEESNDPKPALSTLRLHKGLHELCRALVATRCVSWDLVEQLTTRIARFAQTGSRLVKMYGVDALRPASVTNLLYGAMRAGESGGNFTIIGFPNDDVFYTRGEFMRLEHDPVWLSDLLIVGQSARAVSSPSSDRMEAWHRRWQPWIRRIEACVHRTTGNQRLVQIARDSSAPRALVGRLEKALPAIALTVSDLYQKEEFELLEALVPFSREYDAALSAHVAEDQGALGRYEAAAYVFEEAAWISKHDPRFALLAGTYFGLSGHVGDSDAWLSTAKEIAPTWELPDLERIRIRLHLGLHEEAKELFNNLAAESSPGSTVRMELERDVLFISGDWRQAQDACRGIRERQADNAYNYLVEALCCAELWKATKRTDLRRKGRELAKDARSLGLHDAVDQFEERLK